MSFRCNRRFSEQSPSVPVHLQCRSQTTPQSPHPDRSFRNPNQGKRRCRRFPRYKNGFVRFIVSEPHLQMMPHFMRQRVHCQFGRPEEASVYRVACDTVDVIGTPIFFPHFIVGFPRHNGDFITLFIEIPNKFIRNVG